MDLVTELDTIRADIDHMSRQAERNVRRANAAERRLATLTTAAEALASALADHKLAAADPVLAALVELRIAVDAAREGTR